eukprot:GILI01034789.1.p1 GENE.GILI01034789.1~~GILI01034789.1.p1  ORF type:complete len:314 (-),score=70.82 GILI01034789.1:95-949(-)
MHSANDAGTADSLANFELAVTAARNELAREQKRYDALQANVRASEAKSRDFKIKLIDAEDRCETLENECNRLSHANEQRRNQIAQQKEKLETVIAPRLAIEAETAEIQKTVSATRKQLCKGVMEASISVIASIRDHNPDDLKNKIAAKTAENEAATARIAKYKADLARYRNEKNANAQGLATAIAAAAEENDNAKTEDDPISLAKEIAALEAELAQKVVKNKETTELLTQQREKLRPALRAFGHTMPLAEQAAQNAELRYNELLDQAQGITCCKCGGDLGYEPL